MVKKVRMATMVATRISVRLGGGWLGQDMGSLRDGFWGKRGMGWGEAPHFGGDGVSTREDPVR